VQAVVRPVHVARVGDHSEEGAGAVTPRLVGPRYVMQALSCGKSAAYALMARLGGSKVTGIGWRVPRAALERYLRELERGQACETPSSQYSRAKPSAAATGIATCEPQTAAASSAPCTSETTAAKPVDAPPSPPTGKSKHALRLANMIAESERQRRARSAKPSPPFSLSKSSLES
jgi:hypothetical protein